MNEGQGHNAEGNGGLEFDVISIGQYRLDHDEVKIDQKKGKQLNTVTEKIKSVSFELKGENSDLPLMTRSRQKELS